MTIAIGFRCTDGIVLTVDSEISSGNVTYHGDKAWLFPVPYNSDEPSLKVGVVGAGDLAFIRYAAERINYVLRERMTKDEVQGAVQGVINDIHLNHLYPHPADGGERPSIDLLIGVWAGDGSRLLNTSLTAVTKVVNYEAIGAGMALGNFLIKQFYRDRITVSEAIFLSAYTLKHAKAHVLRCGGRTKILVMQKNGTAGFVQDDSILEIEDYNQRFDEIVRPVLLSGWEDSVSDTEFGQLVDAAARQLKAFRPELLNTVISVPAGRLIVTGYDPRLNTFSPNPPLPLRFSNMNPPDNPEGPSGPSREDE